MLIKRLYNWWWKRTSRLTSKIRIWKGVRDKRNWNLVSWKNIHSLPQKFIRHRKSRKHIVGNNLDDFVFRSSFSPFTKKPLSIFQYSRIVKKWMTMLGKEDISEYSTHSIRKTKSSVIYQKTQNVEIVRRLLCHSNSSATVNYLGIEDSDALDVARTINV